MRLLRGLLAVSLAGAGFAASGAAAAPLATLSDRDVTLYAAGEGGKRGGGCARGGQASTG